MKNKINICFVTDENYAPYMGVTITSILKNAKKNENFDFFIFDNDITETTKSKLKSLENQKVNINFVNVSHIIDKYEALENTVAHISKASYLKFAIADLLPNIDKIIYLDGDLIVKKSLAELYNIELKDNLIAAVEDVGYTYWSQHNEELKLKFKCMNSGVMLINCDLWRKENLSIKLLECAADHDKVGFGQDQPVLNYVLKDRVLFLPFKWNVQDTFFRDEIELKNRNDKKECKYVKKHPIIIHYTYVKKPWDFPAMRKAEEYWKYYKMSPFYDSDLYKKASDFIKQYQIIKILKLLSLTILKKTCNDLRKELFTKSINDELIDIVTPCRKYIFREIYSKDKRYSQKHTLYRILGFKVKVRKKVV